MAATWSLVDNFTVVRPVSETEEVSFVSCFFERGQVVVSGLWPELASRAVFVAKRRLAFLKLTNEK